MANNVTVVALGGAPVLKSANTVAELATQLNLGNNLSVSIGGESADYSTELEDYDFVSFGEKVKGGAKKAPAKKVAIQSPSKPKTKLKKKAKK